jgi:hypothetical protein
VPSPNVGGPNSKTISNQLRGVIAVSANDVWAFGDTDAFGPSRITNLVLHRNGKAWAILPFPDPNPRHTVIDDMIREAPQHPKGTSGWCALRTVSARWCSMQRNSNQGAADRIAQEKCAPDALIEGPPLSGVSRFALLRMRHPPNFDKEFTRHGHSFRKSRV